MDPERRGALVHRLARVVLEPEDRGDARHDRGFRLGRRRLGGRGRGAREVVVLRAAVILGMVGVEEILAVVALPAGCLAGKDQRRQKRRPVGIRPAGLLGHPQHDLAGLVAADLVHEDLHRGFVGLVLDRDPVFAEPLGLAAADPFPHDRGHPEPVVGLALLIALEEHRDVRDPAHAEILLKFVIERSDDRATPQR
jgi:hypothetical protein